MINKFLINHHLNVEIFLNSGNLNGYGKSWCYRRLPIQCYKLKIAPRPTPLNILASTPAKFKSWLSRRNMEVKIVHQTASPHLNRVSPLCHIIF